MPIVLWTWSNINTLSQNDVQCSTSLIYCIYLTNILMLVIVFFHLFGNINHTGMNILEREFILHTFMIIYIIFRNIKLDQSVLPSYLSPSLLTPAPLSFLSLSSCFPVGLSFYLFLFLLQFMLQIKCVLVIMVLWICYQICSW